MKIIIFILFTFLIYGFSSPPNNIPKVKFKNMNTFDRLYIVNGCGPESFPKIIRKLLSKNFYSACAKHDYDYWLGIQKKDKKKADETFKKNMIEEISKNIDGMEIKEIILSIEEIKKDIFSKNNIKNKIINFIYFTSKAIKNTIKIKNNIEELKNIKNNLKKILNEEVVRLLEELSSVSLANIKNIDINKEKLKKYIIQFKRIISMYTYYAIVKYFGKKSFNFKQKREVLPSNINNDTIKLYVKQYNNKYKINFIFKNSRWSLNQKDKNKMKNLLPKLKINF